MSSPDPQGLLPPVLSAQSSLADGSGVRGAIARAAQATGMDFSFLLAQARLESGMNPNARAATSSATGLYQFTDATWTQTLAKHGGALGLDPAALDDPGARAQLMALRTDPQASAMMAAAMAGDNQASLTSALGRPPSSGELYLAHFLGSDGAVKFLSAMGANPGQSAAALLPRAAAANRAVFFDSTGAPRSLAQVMGLINSRLGTALNAAQNSLMQGGVGDDGPDPLTAAGTAGMLGSLVWGDQAASGSARAAAPSAPTGGPIAQAFAEVAAQAGAADGGVGGSMADTLRATFAADSSAVGATAASTPDFVRSAYGRMQALGL